MGEDEQTFILSKEQAKDILDRIFMECNLEPCTIPWEKLEENVREYEIKETKTEQIFEPFRHKSAPIC